MKKFASEFKAFISKGNILDMAVGVIIGGAFGKIVTALVNDILMPLIACLMGNVTVSDLAINLSGEVKLDASGADISNYLRYGDFLQTVIDFFIIAICIFFVTKAFMAVRSKFERSTEESKSEEAPMESAEDILKDIRELLKK